MWLRSSVQPAHPPRRCRIYSAAWQRHTPLLRVLLLLFIYQLPILTSVDAMHAISPAPSTVRCCVELHYRLAVMSASSS